MKKSNGVITLICLLGFVFQSCTKESVKPNDLPANLNELRSFVATSLHTTPDKVVYQSQNKEFVANGDMVVSLEDAQARLQQPSPGPITNGREAQRIFVYRVSPDKIVDVKLYVDGTVSRQWSKAIDSAITHWNGTGSAFHISRLNSGKVKKGQYNILVTTMYEESNVIARGVLPNVYGDVGSRISVNTKYNTLDFTTMQFCTTHEMGHTIGFLHTDQTAGDLIPGTPESDPASVMNSYANPWVGFSPYDIIAVQTIYPK
jgi:hypothetical protein